MLLALQTQLLFHKFGTPLKAISSSLIIFLDHLAQTSNSFRPLCPYVPLVMSLCRVTQCSNVLNSLYICFTRWRMVQTKQCKVSIRCYKVFK